jgi:hypothetical protein
MGESQHCAQKLEYLAIDGIDLQSWYSSFGFIRAWQ